MFRSHFISYFLFFFTNHFFTSRKAHNLEIGKLIFYAFLHRVLPTGINEKEKKNNNKKIELKQNGNEIRESWLFYFFFLFTQKKMNK